MFLAFGYELQQTVSWFYSAARDLLVAAVHLTPQLSITGCGGLREGGGDLLCVVLICPIRVVSRGDVTPPPPRDCRLMSTAGALPFLLLSFSFSSFFFQLLSLLK